MKLAIILMGLSMLLIGYGMSGVVPQESWTPYVEEVASTMSFGNDIPAGAIEKSSPKDRVEENQIIVLPDKVVINMPNAVWSTFTDTNSMDPVLDSGANAIQVVPKLQDDLQVGDIISYESAYTDGTVIHRITEIGNDSGGWFARAKGDNNPGMDPEKIRFDKIKRVVVAIVY